MASKQPIAPDLVIPAPTTGAAIRAARGAYTQTEMANAIGYCGYQEISAIETEKNRMSTERYTLWLLLTGQHPRFELMPKP